MSAERDFVRSAIQKKKSVGELCKGSPIQLIGDDFVLADYIPNDAIRTISLNGQPSKDTPHGYFDGYDFIRQSKIVELKSFKNDERFSEVTTKDMSDKTIRLTYFSTFLVLEVLNAEFDKEFFVLVPEQPDENEMLSQMMGSLYMTKLSLFSDNSETIDFMLCMKFSVMLSKIYSPVEKSFWQKIFG